MARVLNVPKGYPAVLPHGPDIKLPDDDFYTAVHDPDIDVHSLGTMMFDSLERILSKTAGHDEDEAEAHCGRSDGPKFVWKDLSGTPTTVRHRSSEVSRAWGLVEMRLRQLSEVMMLQQANKLPVTPPQ